MGAIVLQVKSAAVPGPQEVVVGVAVGEGVPVAVGEAVWVGVLVGPQEPEMARVTELEVTAPENEGEAMVKVFTKGPGQATVPHHWMVVSNEYIVAGKAEGELQTKVWGSGLVPRTEFGSFEFK
jgi:outer membrane lipoprotein SlyB